MLTERHNTIPLAVQIAVLLFLFITVITLLDLPINHSESQSLWVVDDTAPMWDVAPRDTLRGIRANVTDMLDRIPETGLPPVYFVVFDTWTMLFGETLFTARLLSVLATVGAIAVIIRVTSHFDRTNSRQQALIIASLLAIFPALTIHIYGVLLLCASIAALALINWCNQPQTTLFHALIYLLSLTITLLIAHVTVPMLLVHGLVAWRAQRLRYWGILFTLSLIIITPIMVIFAPSDTAILTSISALQTAVLAGLTVSLPFIVVVFTVKSRLLLPIFRYGSVGLIATISIVLILNKPDWQSTITEVDNLRDDTTPALSAIDPQSALAYYERQDARLSRGITVDVGWRVFTPDEIDTILNNMRRASSIWVILPEDDPNTAEIPQLLAQTRTSTYSQRFDGLHIQRFDLNG